MHWNQSISDSVPPVLLPVNESTPLKVLLKVKPRDAEINSGDENLFNSYLLQDNLFFYKDEDKYQFDSVHEKSTELYNGIKGDLINNIFEGYHTGVITYGSAGTGKSSIFYGTDSTYEGGVVLMFVQDLYDKIDSIGNDTHFTVSLSTIEIHLEKMYDLLVNDRRPLKLHHETKQDDEYYFKDLHVAFVTSRDELINYIMDAESNRFSGSCLHTNYVQRSKSHLITKINVEQRNLNEDVVKRGSISFFDLAAIDFIDKDSMVSLGLTSDEVKKLNLESTTLKNSIISMSELSENPNAVIPYKNSNLTKLLNQCFMGNMKTTVILTCSMLKSNEAETLETLKMGLKLESISSNVHMNKHALNSKKKLDLIVEDMKSKEANYMNRIRLLETELNDLRASYGEAISETSSFKEEMNKERAKNVKLKEELEVFKKLLQKKGEAQSTHSKEMPLTDDEEIMQQLIEKSASVAELKATLDIEKHKSFKLNEVLKNYVEKLQTLKKMNDNLVTRIEKQEDSIQDLLSSNTVMKSQIKNWNNTADSRTERIKLLESKLREQQLKAESTSIFSSPRKQSIGSSSSNPILHSDETSEGYAKHQTASSGWGFGVTKSAFWGHGNISAQRKASTSSMATIESQESPSHSVTTKSFKKGLVLNSIKSVSANPGNTEDNDNK
ncbi:hypothetical protein KAFR_0C04020 [Kazachstania africana CBS 2517]|uniref:Kinesin motor domain-containing protein n=1 Tax=Kazachstania africana (strain ATCC 22294 / BCRC 22015 / CBS 2517 / CECT 1963 / NBRC 1671 / NRRL Y-8276) TaxID=1071382 RepID=H2ASP3_KAZAF|nr:hypothetical protein KAFR_0C04020 [Kazachstania africana CBS 2517]CCF57393.1 hypothetical protein KAFR_0C04020 [Kazachstania africana CBS 2517]